MYTAFLDMREEAAKTENKIVYYLCDLFHTVPKMLEQVEKSEIGYDEILDSISKKAEQCGIEKWLQNSISQLEKQNSGH